MNAKNLRQIEPEEVSRIRLPFDELNWAYGVSGNWGVPKGRISLWSGEPGVGKSRLLAELMKIFGSQGKDSLIFQGEVSAGQFAAEKFRDIDSEHIYISESKFLKDICNDILKISPILVFIDSFQMIRDEKGLARDAGMSPIEYMIENLRSVLSDAGSHLILISQLNKEGKTKGSNDLPHLVDIECYLTKFMVSITDGGLFQFKIEKNRYGKSGKTVIFSHKDWGVECQSNHRLDDSDWQETFKNSSHKQDKNVISNYRQVGSHKKQKNRTRKRNFIEWILGCD